MNCQACKDLKWILFILAWNHLVAVRFLSTVFTVSAQRVNIVAEVDEQPVQFMIRGDLKNVECIIPLIHHMYRSFLRVVHLKSLLIFGSRLKRRVPFSLGLITQTSMIYNICLYICLPLYIYVYIVHVDMAASYFRCPMMTCSVFYAMCLFWEIGANSHPCNLIPHSTPGSWSLCESAQAI